MASFTIELRALIETLGLDEVISWFSSYDLLDYLPKAQIDIIIQSGWSKEKLAQKIIKHYELREIGFETPAYFAKRAAVFMDEIMEEKTPLIYAKTQMVEPLFDTNITETFSGNSQGSSQNIATSNGSGLTVNSNTPQGQINKTAILNGSYASSTSANEGESSNTSNGSSDSSNTYTKSIKGNQRKSQAELLNDYQKFMTAINKEIIDRAGCLFINIYEKGF
jgi:hypothetical protein